QLPNFEPYFRHWSNLTTPFRAFIITASESKFSFIFKLFLNLHIGIAVYIGEKITEGVYMFRRSSSLLVVLLTALVVLSLSAPLFAQETMATTAECGSEGYAGNWKSLEVVDSMTLKITLCNADPAFPSKIAFAGFPINSSEYLETTGGAGDLLQKPIGTGP